MGTRTINALTALLRTIDLGAETRKALFRSQIKLIAGWRSRADDAVLRACRCEAVRLATHLDPNIGRGSLNPCRT
jgi:transposase